MSQQLEGQNNHIVKKCASFLMQGYWQPLLVAFSTVLTTLFFMPLLKWVPMTIVALRTLVNGPRDGVLVGGLILIPAAVLFMALGYAPLVKPWLLTFGLTWAFASFLHHVPSWSLLIKLMTLVALIFVAVLNLTNPELTENQLVFFEELLAGLPTDNTELDTAIFLEAIKQAAPAISSMYATLDVFSCLIYLFIGRWLQAMLYNPGGLREELHHIRMGKFALVALMLVMVAAWLLNSWIPWVYSLIPPVILAFMLAGVSLVHCVIYQTVTQKNWRIILILLFYLAFLMSYLMVPLLVFVAAILDVGLNFRRRIKPKQQ